MMKTKMATVANNPVLAELERAASRANGCNVELTIRGNMEFTATIPGREHTARVVAWLQATTRFSVRVDEPHYDAELDETFIYFAVGA